MTSHQSHAYALEGTTVVALHQNILDRPPENNSTIAASKKKVHKMHKKKMCHSIALFVYKCELKKGKHNKF